jgi:hypothetical protein
MIGLKMLVNDLVRKIPVSLRILRVGVLLVLPLLSIPARAGFDRYYAPDNFTLINNNADGWLMSADGGLSVVLTGGNNGSGLSGTTDLVISAPMGGTVQFSYLFTTLDIDPVTGAAFDDAGYLVGGAFIPFTPLFSADPVPLSFTVVSGQSFGFRVETLDNTGEPGILTISDFTAPQSVPEPGFGPLLALLAGGLVVRQLYGRHCRSREFIQGGNMKFGLTALAVGLFLSASLSAQTQFYYSAADATGRLKLTSVTNARQASVRMLAHGPRQSTPEIKPHIVEPQRPFKKLLPMRTALGSSPVQSLAVSYTTTSSSFLGLTHYDQRNANQGNQFSVEPPSQEVAVNKGYVLEGVNNAIQVYTTSGTPLLPTALSTNQLFGVPAAIDRNTGVNGVYPTDMRVFYDSSIDRWFVLQRAQDNDPSGNPLNSSHLYLAVSQTGDPTATYNVYVMDTTNPLRIGCPCFSDFPQIGADQYGIYISSDEYDTVFGQPADSSILAISKPALGSGASAPVMQEFVIPRSTGYEQTIRPAITPPGASYFVASGGVEFFVSTNYSSYIDSNFAIWALTNSASLTTTPNLTLIQTIVPAMSYTFPNPATQRPGPLPYGLSLVPPGQLAYIDGGFNSRVLSLVYSGGRLYVTFATQALDQNGRAVVAGGYAILSPTFRGGRLAAPVLRRGYLVVNNNNVLRPAISVTAQGRGAIVFTVVGPDYYPSAAFVPIDTFSTGATAQIAGPGVLPEDGFTGYDGGGVARWGDYSSAVTASDGSIWMATEYIPNAPRTEFANWGTRVIRYVP